MPPPDATAKAAHVLNIKKHIVQLDSEDIGEAITYDSNEDLDVSVIIQEGFEEPSDTASPRAATAPASPPPASPPPSPLAAASSSPQHQV